MNKLGAGILVGAAMYFCDPSARAQVAAGFDAVPSMVDAADRQARQHFRCLRAVSGDPEDRGVVAAGSVVQRVVRFSNTSDQPVRVAVISTTCGCLSAVFDKTEVPPGGATVLTMTASVPPVIGVQVQSARLLVSWNEGGQQSEQRGQCVMRYAADVTFQTLPDISRRTVVEGDAIDWRLWLRWVGGSDVDGAEFRSGEFDGVSGVTVNGPLEPEGCRGVLAFEARGTAPAPGHYRGRFVVHTNISSRPEIGMDWYLTVLPRWAAHPPGVVFGAGERTEALRLRCRGNRENARQPSSVQVVGDSKVSAMLSRDQDETTVSVRLLERPAAPYGSAVVKVLSDDGQCLVAIPVAWFPQQPECVQPAVPEPGSNTTQPSSEE